MCYDITDKIKSQKTSLSQLDPPFFRYHSSNKWIYAICICIRATHDEVHRKESLLQYRNLEMVDQSQFPIRQSNPLIQHHLQEIDWQRQRMASMREMHRYGEFLSFGCALCQDGCEVALDPRWWILSMARQNMQLDDDSWCPWLTGCTKDAIVAVMA